MRAERPRAERQNISNIHILSRNDHIGMPRKCIVCDESCDNKDARTKILHCIRKSEIPSSVSPSLCCIECDAVFQDGDQCDRHMEEEHRYPQYEETGRNTSLPTVAQTAGRRLYIWLQEVADHLGLGRTTTALRQLATFLSTKGCNWFTRGSRTSRNDAVWKDFKTDIAKNAHQLEQLSKATDPVQRARELEMPDRASDHFILTRELHNRLDLSIHECSLLTEPRCVMLLARVRSIAVTGEGPITTREYPQGRGD